MLKKKLMLVPAALPAALIVVGPVQARGAVDESPGWSHENPGQGGSATLDPGGR